MSAENNQSALPDPAVLILQWPEGFNPAIDRERYVRISSSVYGPQQNIRSRSWDVLADLYAIDELGLRGAKAQSFGGEPAAALVHELGVPVRRESGLIFQKSKLITEPGRGYCFPDEVDDLDIRSFYQFGRDMLDLKDWGRNAHEDRLLRSWKASKKAGPQIVDHWIRTSQYLVLDETKRLAS